MTTPVADQKQAAKRLMQAAIAFATAARGSSASALLPAHNALCQAAVDYDATTAVVDLANGKGFRP